MRMGVEHVHTGIEGGRGLEGVQVGIESERVVEGVREGIEHICRRIEGSQKLSA